MNDFNLEPVELRSAMISGVEDVFKSGHYVLGKMVVEFKYTNPFSSNTD